MPGHAPCIISASTPRSSWHSGVTWALLCAQCRQSDLRSMRSLLLVVDHWLLSVSQVFAAEAYWDWKLKPGPLLSPVIQVVLLGGITRLTFTLVGFVSPRASVTWCLWPLAGSLQLHSCACLGRAVCGTQWHMETYSSSGWLCLPSVWVLWWIHLAGGQAQFLLSP